MSHKIFLAPNWIRRITGFCVIIRTKIKRRTKDRDICSKKIISKQIINIYYTGNEKSEQKGCIGVSDKNKKEFHFVEICLFLYSKNIYNIDSILQI